MRARLPVAWRLALCGFAIWSVACDSRSEAMTSAPRLSSLPVRPQLMFVSVANDDTFHKMAVASLDAPARGAFVSGLSCDRVYFGGGRGFCLASVAGASTTTWWAHTFDERFEVHALAADR